MGNILSTDLTTDKLYKHSGFTATIDDSFNPIEGSNPLGITWTGGFDNNILVADDSTNKHYKYSSFSSSLLDSYFITSLRDISYDGNNVLSVREFPNGSHRLHSGFSSTITDSYDPPGSFPVGIAWDQTNDNVLSSDDSKFRQHVGFTASITDSFSAGFNHRSIEEEEGNVLSADFAADKLFRFAGFTSTIQDSIASPGNAPHGIGWDGRVIFVSDSVVVTWVVANPVLINTVAALTSIFVTWTVVTPKVSNTIVKVDPVVSTWSMVTLVSFFLQDSVVATWILPVIQINFNLQVDPVVSTWSMVTLVSFFLQDSVVATWILPVIQINFNLQVDPVVSTWKPFLFRAANTLVIVDANMVVFTLVEPYVVESFIFIREVPVIPKQRIIPIPATERREPRFPSV